MSLRPRIYYNAEQWRGYIFNTFSKLCQSPLCAESGPPVGFVEGSLQEAITRKYSFYTYCLNIANCYVY